MFAPSPYDQIIAWLRGKPKELKSYDESKEFPQRSTVLTSFVEWVRIDRPDGDAKVNSRQHTAASGLSAALTNLSAMFTALSPGVQVKNAVNDFCKVLAGVQEGVLIKDVGVAVGVNAFVAAQVKAKNENGWAVEVPVVLVDKVGVLVSKCIEAKAEFDAAML